MVDRDDTILSGPDDPTTPLPAAGSRDVTSPLGGETGAAPSERRYQPGAILGRRYRIIRFLGAGGMGEVYEGEDLELGGRVAIKTVLPLVAADPAMAIRFRREIQIARKVTHPNVCRVFDLAFDEGPRGVVSFVTMEMLEGRTLRDRLRADGPMDEAEALVVARQICAGLEAAHESGVVHRDLKSANVIVVPRRGSLEGRAVVTDFGLAHLHGPESDAAHVTRSGQLMGTPAYIAPEQLEGADSSPATDIYALGVVLFEMVTGRLPFEDVSLAGMMRRLSEPPPSPRAIVPTLSRSWESVILRCLARDPARRFASAREVASALESHAVVEVPRPRRRRLLPAIGAAACVAAVAAFLLLRTPAPEPSAAAPGKAAPEAVGPARKSVAVLGFKNMSGRAEADWLASALPEMLTTELAAADALRTIPGENVARASVELGLTPAEALSGETLAKIRSNLGADYVVVGSFVRIGDGEKAKLRVDLRLQDAAAGQTIASISENGGEDALFDLVSRAGGRLRSSLGGSALSDAERRELRASLPSNAEAARLYVEGLAALHKRDARAALPLLEGAVAKDPSYPLVRAALSDALEILGDDRRALAEARKAFELSGSLARQDKLLVEGRFRQRAAEWPRAIEIYTSLVNFYPDDLEHRLALAMAQLDASRFADALGSLGAARRLPPPLGADARIDLYEAWVAEARSDWARLKRAADDAIRKAEGSEAVTIVAEALCSRAEARGSTGDLDGAKADYAEARRLFEQAGDRAGVAKTLRKGSVVFYYAGDIAEAKRQISLSLDVYRTIGQRRGLAGATGALGVIENSTGEYASARKRFEEAKAIYAELGDRGNVAWAETSIANGLLMSGRTAEAIERYRASLAISREVGDRGQEALTLANIASAELALGELAAARASLDEASSAWTRLGDRRSVAYATSQLGRIDFEQNRMADARKRHGEALAVRRELGLDRDAAVSQVSIAALDLDEGKPAEAAALARASLAVLEANDDRDAQAETWILIARAARESGDAAGAREALRRADELLKATEDPELRYRAELVALEVGALLDPATAAVSERRARAIARKAQDAAMAGTWLMARLLAVELGSRQRGASAVRADAIALERDARARGFERIAARAAAVR